MSIFPPSQKNGYPVRNRFLRSGTRFQYFTTRCSPTRYPFQDPHWYFSMRRRSDEKKHLFLQKGVYINHRQVNQGTQSDVKYTSVVLHSGRPVFRTTTVSSAASSHHDYKRAESKLQELTMEIAINDTLLNLKKLRRDHITNELMEVSEMNKFVTLRKGYRKPKDIT